jgi:DNA-binding transcriptional LysR family regulator
MQVAALPSSNRVPARPIEAARVAAGPDRTDSHAACSLSLIATRADFEALEPQWNALFERAGRPHQFFQTFNWLWHWADHYLDCDTEPVIVAGWRHGLLVMAWPTIATRALGVRTIAWMGEPVSPYGDVLVEDGPGTLDLLRQGWARLTSLDADVIKSYVELGLGVGIIASMAFEPARDTNLRLIDATGLFPLNTSRIAVRQGRYLRGYAYRFIELCSPDLKEAFIRSSVTPKGEPEVA